MTRGAQLEAQLEREAEAHRRIAEVLETKEFMQGVYEAMSEVQHGDRPVPWENLTRKYGRS